MKRSDLIYEAYLLLITLLVVIGWITDETHGLYMYIFWAIMLPFFQLGHSIVMKISYPGNEKLKTNLRLFWSFLPLAAIPFAAVFTAIPLALFFWILTWRHRRRAQYSK